VRSCSLLPLSSVFTDLDSRSNSTRSLPKILIEFSPFTPESASITLSRMYWEKFQSIPGSLVRKRSFMALTSSSLRLLRNQSRQLRRGSPAVRSLCGTSGPRVHCFSGLSGTENSTL